MLSFGESIKKMRLARNMTQKDLADRIGVSATHISYLENNRRNPSHVLLEKIGDALGIPQELILWDALPVDILALSKQEREIVLRAKKIVSHVYAGQGKPNPRKNDG